MNAMKKVLKSIRKRPGARATQVFVALIEALETESMYSMHQLYELSVDDFDLALELIREWRCDRHIKLRRKLREILEEALDNEGVSEESPRRDVAEADKS
jgi:hypothetical protein